MGEQAAREAGGCLGSSARLCLPDFLFSKVPWFASIAFIRGVQSSESYQSSCKRALLSKELQKSVCDFKVLGVLSNP